VTAHLFAGGRPSLARQHTGTISSRGSAPSLYVTFQGYSCRRNHRKFSIEGGISPQANFVRFVINSLELCCSRFVLLWAMSPFKRALLLAAIAYCILCLARGESFDPVALAKDENADLSALSGEQLYAVADEDAVQFSKTHPLGDDITYSYRIGESHALKHHLSRRTTIPVHGIFCRRYRGNSSGFRASAHPQTELTAWF
jgi:hypothetical protein